MAAVTPLMAEPDIVHDRVVDAAFVSDHENVSVYLDYVEQARRIYTIEDMLQDQSHPWIRWQHNFAVTPGFGFDTHPFWFRLVVSNSNQKVIDRLLEIRNPVLDNVLFYQVDPDGKIVNVAQTGDGSPTDERPFFHHNLILPIKIPAGETQYLYFRVTTAGALEFPLDMWAPAAFQQRDQLQLLFYGALFGILVVMGVYNFFIYTLFRDWGFVYYAGFSFGLMMFQASIHGFLAQYLWPESAWWREHSLVVIIPITVYCAMQYSATFLQLRYAYPYMTGLIRVASIFCFALVALAPLVDYAILIRISAALVFPVCVLAIALGLHRWLNGYQPARYFVLAWTAFLVAIAYYSLGKFGLFERTQFSEYAVQVGAVLEAVLFAFALADRMSTQRKSFIAAQRRALELQRAANEQLEHNVEERTQELRHAMDELGLANRRLQALTMQDGLTGIRNRRYFDDKLGKEWQRAVRSRNPLALLLIDIDYFKSFNDKYGHLAGDECLKRVARVIEETVTRPSDSVARYGGEEFAVVLPDTSTEGAMHVAENIRRAVERLQISFEGTVTHVSVSIGAAVVIPEEHREAHILIAVADQALYSAKSSGRNRTELAQPSFQL